MGYVKWFCALVGFMYGRFWGGVMGYLIGSAIESMLLASPKSMDDRYDRYQTRSPREGFMYSLMILWCSFLLDRETVHTSERKGAMS